MPSLDHPQHRESSLLCRKWYLRFSYLATCLLAATLLPSPLPSQSAEGPTGFEHLDGEHRLAERVDDACGPAPAGDLARLHDELVRSIQHDASAPEWAAVACVRAHLAVSGAFVRQAVGVPLGQDWRRAALVAALRRVEAAPEDTAQGKLLAALGIATAGLTDRAVEPSRKVRTPSRYGDRERILGALFRATRVDEPPPEVLRACVSLGIQDGERAVARDCLTRALEAGHDSTWHLLRLAAMGYWAADTLLGRAAFDRAAQVARTLDAKHELGWHLEAGYVVDGVAKGSRFANGIFNMNAVTYRTLLPLGRFADEERAAMLAMPPYHYVSWIDSVARALHSDTELPRRSQTDRYRLMLSPGMRYTAIWDHGELVTRKIFKHFHLTAYAWGSFRPCGIGERRSIPCFPSTIPTYGAVITASLQPGAVWSVADAQQLLVGWATAGQGLEGATAADIRWSRWGLEVGTAFQAESKLDVPATYQRNQWLMGVSTIPAAPPDASTLGMMVEAGVSGRGGVHIDGVAPLSDAPLAISDPVLGQVGNAVTWRDESGNEVLISPLATFARKSTVELAYQIRQQGTDSAVTTRLRILGESAVFGDLREPLVTLRFSDAITPGVQWMRRTLEMPDLPTGSYALELAVAGADGVFGAARVARFDLK